MLSQPRANRIDAILESIVPSKKDPTSGKVFAIVRNLLKNDIIRKDEVGAVYCAILQRIAKYNSNNVQSNLDTLFEDIIKSSSIISKEHPITASLLTFNSFLKTIPAAIGKGQEDYMQVIQALRALISETNNVEMYKSGPHFFLNVNIRGAQSINLTKAFSELSHIWNLRSTLPSGISISSLLTPNTRLFLVMISPFINIQLLNQDSYISFLFKLYKGSFPFLGQDNILKTEIANISEGIKESDTSNIHDTLHFLLTNKKKIHDFPSPLSSLETSILRQIQKTVKSILQSRPHLSPSVALDLTSANLDHDLYTQNIDFINSIFDYMHKAAALNPDYFLHSVLNKYWSPPENFRSGDYRIPTVDNWIWDDEPTTSEPLRANSVDDIDLLETASIDSGENMTRNTLQNMLALKDTNIQQANKQLEDTIETLTDDFRKKWVTYRHSNDELTGHGRSLFEHLKPKGVF